MNASIPAVGATAETADGKLLGTVGSVEGDYLRIDPADRQDAYWLPVAAVQDVSGEVAHFDFDQDKLDERIVPVPPGEVHRAPDDRGPLPSEQETRETMLRQMAEQRQELRSDGADMPDEDRTIGEPVEEELERLEGGRSPEP